MENAKRQAFAEFLANQPIKEVKNPYWLFNDSEDRIDCIYGDSNTPLSIDSASELLDAVRTYFKAVYDTYQSEAQVLCLHIDDAHHLIDRHIPRFDGEFTIMGIPVVVFVLPQYNTPSNTVINETFWQTAIAGRRVIPVCRIHSHHVLDAYQSITDYSTLNSNTLEMVIGHITHDLKQVCFWLDVKNTNKKDNVWVADETQTTFAVRKIPNGNFAHNLLKAKMQQNNMLTKSQTKFKQAESQKEV